MFINYIKELFLKKALRKHLKPVKESNLNKKIQKVGVIIDYSRFIHVKELIHLIIQKGIIRKDIQLLILDQSNKLKNNSTILKFTYNDLKINGTFENNEVLDFLEYPFDLLINCYDIDEPALLLASNQSKAMFKAGFSAVNKKVNHLMITTHIDNYKIFVEELFKYLKILNKI